jgi:hypothetical protein
MNWYITEVVPGWEDYYVLSTCSSSRRGTSSAVHGHNIFWDDHIDGMGEGSKTLSIDQLRRWLFLLRRSLLGVVLYC